jgi:hypothetical protein
MILKRLGDVNLKKSTSEEAEKISWNYHLVIFARVS